MAKKKVLMTGASGYIASQMLPAFRRRYDLVLLDVSADGPQTATVWRACRSRT